MVGTIFALATPPGRSGICVVRVSGPEAFAACDALCGRVPAPRMAELVCVRDPADGRRLDQGLVFCFPGPASFTGEDVVEFHLHGSRAVYNSVLEVLAGLKGLRPAAAGDFTRRALMNGKMDLPAVEGLGDLLTAETAAQQAQALDLMSGHLTRIAEAWRERLVRAMACLAASFDFADEDVPTDACAQARPLVAAVHGEMTGSLAGAEHAERVNDGFEVAIVGRPNVGKSTLLNALAGRDAALTSDLPGTTRDIVEIRMDLGGIPVVFLDTAGLRETDEVIESQGIARAVERARGADLRVVLIEEEGEALPAGLSLEDDDLVVGAKSDTIPWDSRLSISGTTGQGVTQLLEAIAQRLAVRVSKASPLAHRRQRMAVERGVACLERGLDRLRESDTELAAFEIGAALQCLDVLVGKTDIENVLDVVFESFCIGK